MYKAILVVAVCFLSASLQVDLPCIARYFDEDSIVCVCDPDYCDTSNPELPGHGQYLLVESDKAGQRFATSYGTINNITTKPSDEEYKAILLNKLVNLELKRDVTRQKIIGYGGAFTDAVGYNLRQISDDLVEQIYEAYFGESGLKYNMARTTMGHSDYSLNEYYHTSEENDFNMNSWKLRAEDFEYRIPYIKKAMEMSQDDFLVHTSIWTCPPWLRRFSDSGVNSTVIERYYSSYSLYIMRFLEAFRNEGIEFWAVSYANEPTVTLGVILSDIDNAMFTTWTLNKLAEFAVNHFVPDLVKYGLDDIKVMFLDDTRTILMISTIQTFLNIEGVADLMQFTGLHSYFNSYVSPSLVDNYLTYVPNNTIITTELCAGQGEGVRLGYWQRAEYYVQNYLQELHYHHSAWLDWNLALNLESGPHFAGVDVDAPIVIDTENDKFYKQPSYYAIGHFSKFIPRGSVYVALDSPFPTDLQYAAVLRPDGYVTAVLYNPLNTTVDVNIRDVKRNIHLKMTPNSINTVVF